MGFSAKQLQALRRQPNRSCIRTREAHGRELTYLEGWYAISEANRIFGFDGWNRETIESRCVLARENRGTFCSLSSSFEHGDRVPAKRKPARHISDSSAISGLVLRVPTLAIIMRRCSFGVVGACHEE